MNYRRIGASGLKVSAVSLGSWLTYGESVGANAAKECVAAALDAGVNCFDTADVYAHGNAERVLGELLAGRSRSAIVIATKCFFPMGDGPNDRGLSRKHVIESCNESLRRLRVDYIDLYQCHRYDPETPIEETVAAMDHLIRSGKILYWGVSAWPAEQISSALRIATAGGFTKPISDQARYNALDREIEPAVLPLCEREGLGILAYSPLAQGLLTGKYSGRDVPEASRASNRSINSWITARIAANDVARAARLHPIAEKCGVPMSRLALAWCLARAVVSTVIMGASSAEQVRENVKAAELTLSPEILAEIDGALIESRQ